MTITYKAIDFANPGEAIQYADAAGGVAVLVDGPPQVVSQADADRLDKAGVEFAYLVDHEMPDGEHRIMTVPVN
jgi:hypothetical protein